MKLSTNVRSISHLKAHAADLFRTVEEEREPFVITQNGDAKVVIQDVQSYEAIQQQLALLKILALGKRQIEEGQVAPAGEVFGRIRRTARSR